MEETGAKKWGEKCRKKLQKQTIKGDS